MAAMVQSKRRRRSVMIGAALIAITAAIIVFLPAWWRARTDLGARALRAYDDGQWADAARLAREILAVRKNDRETFRLLARASARLGRDSSALAIYQRWFNESGLETEDLILLGMVQQRQGRSDVASKAWQRVIATKDVPARSLEELAQYCMHGRHWEEAIAVAERLSQQPGWETRGTMILGTIRYDLNNVPAAAELFRRVLKTDPSVIDTSHHPAALRKAIARSFLQMNRPGEARPLLQAILDRAPDPEASWLLSRAYLQEGDKPLAVAALKKAGTYRTDHPLQNEPGPYVGEGRCEKCHSKIFKSSKGNRHTRTYYRGVQLDELPVPDRSLPDPDDARVVHTIDREDGVIHEKTQVGNAVFDAVIEYAFGTADRALTMVSRDSKGGYHIGRLSYYESAEGKGWDRSTLDESHPDRAQPASFQGQTIGVRDGLAKCLYCHVTNPRTGHDAIGPEANDRAIGCERCHGPGGNHVLALDRGFPDMAIVNPKFATPAAVTSKQCNDCHILQKKFRDNVPENPGWVRSQGVGWARSRCSEESDGAFGCVTCHDPHVSARAISMEVYESKCIDCHGSTVPRAGKETAQPAAPPGASASYTPCPVNPKSGCIGCHMPRVRIESLHTELTDHHIRVHATKQ